jgi:fluoroacetyl-CoA thioesterase
MSTSDKPAAAAGQPAPGSPLVPGLVHEFTLTVEHHLTIASFNPRLPAVFGTPAMIMAMEVAAAHAVAPHLPPGMLTVGTAIHVEHLAATPEGMQVRVRAELTAVNGRFLEFKVEAHDRREQIGRGTVGRAIVDRARFEANVSEKARSL